MGLFKTEEEKKELEQKEMQKLIEKYNLTDLDEEDNIIVKKVAQDLYAMGYTTTMIKLGSAMSSTDRAVINYLQALTDQNWIMINQLSRINKKLNK